MLRIKKMFLILITIVSLMFIASCDFFYIPGTGYTVEYETYDLCDIPNEEDVISLPEELPSPTVKGYEFGGWYYDEACMIQALGSDLIVEDTTLYALWIRLKYTVTLIKNIEGVSNEEIKNVTNLSDLPTLTQTGYEFGGWYYDKDLTQKVNSQDEVYSDITLYAKWDIKKYKITFSSAIGEKPATISDVLTIPTNLPTLEAEGYKFIGWYTDNVLKTPVVLEAELSANLTLYAKWVAVYSVTYNNNGHGEAIEAKNKISELPELPVLVSEGYEFDGWYYDQSFTKQANDGDVLNKNVTLYAKWNANQYNVNFNLNGALGTIESITAQYDAEFTIPTCEIINKGYKFVGWNTKADGSGNNYKALDKVKNLSKGEDVSLYAIWEQLEYTLTIQLNNGQNDVIHTLTYQQALPSVENPTKQGAEFEGWYTYVNGVETKFTFENAKMPDSNILVFAKYLGEVSILFVVNDEVVQTITGIENEEITNTIKNPTVVGHTFVGWYLDVDYQTAYNLTTFPMEDTFVYAKFTPNKITINFNSNGGTGTMNPQIIEYGSGTPLNQNTFERTGYKFVGWEYDDKTYINGYDKDIIAEGSITLKAVWERLVYTVTFNTNGHGTQPAQLKGVYKLPDKLPILIEEGFIFIGWYYDSSFNNQANVNDVVTKNTTLYAKWEMEDVPTPEPTEKIVEDIIYDDFQIHFLELGNGNSGDSVYIKAGKVDVLIDAGSKRNSTNTLISHINKYRTPGDDVIDYVIATHAHEDHIAGFVGESGVSTDGILYEYKIGTIIDFAYKNTTSGVSSEYIRVRDDLVSKGTKHYTAAQCFNQTDGAKQTYELADGITMSILYNYYYFNKTSDENDYSVCTMFTYKDHNFMFTGDLEEGGEQKLAAYYDGSTPAKTLPQVEVFKAGHHGSKTSSNECLLEKIQPEIVCVCCCAGGSEYTKYYQNTFPTQEMINRVAKYTDRVYATTAFNISKLTYESLNGVITISSNGTNVGISATNNIKKLKDSEWFNTIIYANSSGVYCSSSTNYYNSATSGVTARPQRVWPS